MLNLKSRGTRQGVEGLTRMCAVLYDTQRDGLWKGEAQVEPFVKVLVESGVDEEDILCDAGVSYDEFSNNVFSKLNLSKPEHREYNILVHRMGPSEFGKIKQGFTGLYIKTHKESIVRNDVYDDCSGLVIRSSRSGAQVKLGHPNCTFIYGPISFELPLDKAWEWTGTNRPSVSPPAPVQPVLDPSAPAGSPPSSSRTEISAEFRDLADKFFSRELDPHEFERFIGLLFEANGWRADVKAAPGRDEGVDGWLYYDIPLKPEPVKYVMQAKRYYSRSRVGDPIFTHFLGVINKKGADGGVLATTGEFTRELREEYSIEGSNIAMYDGKDLNRMAKDVLERGYFQYAPSSSFPSDEKKERGFGMLVARVYAWTKTAQDSIKSDLEFKKWPSPVDTDVYNENLDGRVAVSNLCAILGLLCSNMRNDRLVRKNRRELREVLEIIKGFPTEYQVEDLRTAYHHIEFKVG